MSVDVRSLAADLAAEHDALDAVVSRLAPEIWGHPTPSAGWTIADQIGHLTYFDRAATLAIEDPERFAAVRDALLEAGLAGTSPDDVTLGEFRAMSPAELLRAWREQRRRLLAATGTLGGGDRVVWYGPSMSAKSFVTARLMETWAHGQDVVDAAVDAGVEASRQATDRLRHIAQLGVITRSWSYQNRGLTAPEGDVRVALTSPSGDLWSWGPDDAEESITGPAEDFCMVVTQRRHHRDTDLVIAGDAATDWMVHAQAFAGPPTDGPPPRPAA